MSDLIKKRDAIEALNAVDVYGDGIGFEVLSHAIRDVALLPTVDAEPEHGHWIINGEWCTCSECKQSLHYERSKGKSNLINALSMAVHYCPNCGAKMDGEVERETD